MHEESRRGQAELSGEKTTAEELVLPRQQVCAQEAQPIVQRNAESPGGTGQQQGPAATHAVPHAQRRPAAGALLANTEHAHAATVPFFRQADHRSQAEIQLPVLRQMPELPR